jgi:hypothetical protein
MVAMMGKEEGKNNKLFWGFDIGTRVPEEHLLRKLNRVLDLKFLYESVAEKYGRKGNVSVPPPVIMKMMLLLSLYNVRSERDVYICPAGKELVRRSRNPLRGWINYNASRLDCDACPLKPQCTGSKTGRTINRFEEDDILAAARKEAHSDASRKDLKQRQELMERSFAYSVRFGFKRARYRGLWRVYIQQLVIATVQNLIRMARHLFPTPNNGTEIGSSLARLLAFLTISIASVASLIRSEPIGWRLTLDEKLCRAA